MKNLSFFVRVLAVMTLALVAAAVLGPIFTGRHPEAQRSICQTNLKQIGLAMQQYAQDNDEHFPPVHITASMGWADAIFPYAKSQQIFQCNEAHSTTSTFTTDYFYNRRLNSLSLGKLRNPSWTLLCGDGTDNAPTWTNLGQLPVGAVTNPTSPALRHLGKWGNYVFADGHVKALSPTQIKGTSPNPNRPWSTFAVQ